MSCFAKNKRDRLAVAGMVWRSRHGWPSLVEGGGAQGQVEAGNRGVSELGCGNIAEALRDPGSAD
jgi:hypothetical protein